MAGADQTLAYLLDFDGEAIVYDGGYVARFRVERIRATLGRPHGVSYALTFHAPDGRRLMGYDNATAWRIVAVGSSSDRLPLIIGTATKDKGRPYRFETAEKLIADFFDEIGRILKERNDG